MSKRRHGKICFLDLRDSEGNIQVFARKMSLKINTKTLRALTLEILSALRELYLRQKLEKSQFVQLT